jgi:MFS family permease
MLAFAPGVLAVLLLLTLREKPSRPSNLPQKKGLFSYLQYWKQAPLSFRRVVPALLLFALFNSSDIFLLLIAREWIGDTPILLFEKTIPADTWLIGAYILYNAIYALTAYPLGKWAARMGTQSMIVIGLLLFAFVYAGFGTGPNTQSLLLFFSIYGIYAAATEGMIKAWITEQVPTENSATAIGFYSSLESLCTWMASGIAGMLWTFGFASLPFLISAGVALGVAVYLFLLGKLKAE